jgi:hypothetical protein
LQVTPAAVLGERGLDRRPLAAARVGAHRREHRDLVHRHGVVLDEAAVRKVGIAGQAQDVEAEGAQRVAVGAVLIDRAPEVDRLALQERQLAARERG